MLIGRGTIVDRLWHQVAKNRQWKIETWGVLYIGFERRGTSGTLEGGGIHLWLVTEVRVKGATCEGERSEGKEGNGSLKVVPVRPGERKEQVANRRGENPG